MKKSYRDLKVWQKSVDLAEGSARHTDKEFKQFLIMARGSAAELQTQMLIAMRVGYLAKNVYMTLSTQLNEAGKMLYGLKQSLGSTAIDYRLRTKD